MIDISQYRITIGVFLCVIRSNHTSLCREMFFWWFIYLNFIFKCLVVPNLIKQCGDIESNPGPILKEPQFCHIHLRSITADGDTSMGTTKFQEFESFVAGYNFEIIGISETWLDNSIDNENIALKHYLPPIRRDRNRHVNYK